MYDRSRSNRCGCYTFKKKKKVISPDLKSSYFCSSPLISSRRPHTVLFAHRSRSLIFLFSLSRLSTLAKASLTLDFMSWFNVSFIIALIQCLCHKKAMISNHNPIIPFLTPDTVCVHLCSRNAHSTTACISRCICVCVSVSKRSDMCDTLLTAVWGSARPSTSYSQDWGQIEVLLLPQAENRMLTGSELLQCLPVLSSSWSWLLLASWNKAKSTLCSTQCLTSLNQTCAENNFQKSMVLFYFHCLVLTTGGNVAMTTGDELGSWRQMEPHHR